MPAYRFRLLPEDGVENVELRFLDDDAALHMAKATLRDVLSDAARKGEPAPKTLEVVREDGTVVGLVTAEED
jgi:hypothetical protein